VWLVTAETAIPVDLGRPRRFVSLFWRLFLPNASVLAVAGVVLLVEPANGRVLA